VPGLNEHYLEANRLDNLVLVCRMCHQRLESGVRVRTGLDGLAYALNNLAPLYLMCDLQDLGVHVARTTYARSDHPPADLPSIFLYERVTAGLGFSARLYELHDDLMDAAVQLIRGCSCPHGCPGCVGPVLEDGPVLLETKQLTLALVNAISRS
jgi:DEAD/DEAH box helicase domain-containing protein